MNTDYIYWTFSAAAQSISAFVAFLLTGYALVHSYMEAARQQDDSLEEIHAALRSSYHTRLMVLTWLTGAAIVLSLLVVYFNRPDRPVHGWILAVVASGDVAAVVCGLIFVVSIVDPRKYQKAAEKALEDAPETVSGTTAPAAEFFDAVMHLERLMRDYLKDNDVYVPTKGAQRPSYTIRQMIEALFQGEIIDRAFYNELLDLSKYRNLVLHGHVDSADQAMLQRVKAASARMRELG